MPALALGLPLLVPDAAATTAAASAGATAAADGSTITAEFDTSMLSGGQARVDLSRFEHGNPVLPGTYRVDIYLNSRWVGRSDVRFAARSPDASATPCVTLRLLRQLGLSLARVPPAQMKALTQPRDCVDFPRLVPDGSLVFDLAELRLDASVPQAWLGHQPRGYVPPAYWDNGVPALLLDYSFNGYRSRTAGFAQDSAYLGLRTGLNIGPWHLRHDGAASWRSGQGRVASQRQWQAIDTYAQRDLPDWRSQLTLGDAYTRGDLFDSVRLRGVALATDDRMLPESLRGYAPTVSGTAQSNAKVTIRQNGVLIYETTVAPGPFVIDDLYPTGYGGDLQVTVTEADGRVRRFDVPYASVPQLLRKGSNRYAVTVGTLHDAYLSRSPLVAEATLQRGFSNLFTGYAGVVGSSGYAAALLGGAFNTRLGAFAVDLTGARTTLPGRDSSAGQSLRLSYSKTFPQTDTSLSVATYRYSTRGYLGLRDALLARAYAQGGRVAGNDPRDGANVAPPGTLVPGPLPSVGAALAPSTGLPDRQRSRFDLTLHQRLGDRAGSLFASATARDYWSRHGTDVQFQVGYTNRWHQLSYSLSANRARGLDGRTGNEVLATFSLPFGDSPRAPSLTANLGRGPDGGLLEQATIAGTADAAGQFNYGATFSHAPRLGDAGSLYGGYRGSFAQLDASYGKGRGYTQASLGAAGAVVVYPGGVSFGQAIGDTVGIVEAPDAAGARVVSVAGLEIDRFGHALVPYLTPYKLNTIQIDPKGLPLGVQLDATSAQVAPHAGAVVILRFKTESGRTVLARVRLASGAPVPFGAELVDQTGASLGVVGQAGMTLLRGVGPSGTITARWQGDDGAARTCHFDYRLPSPAEGDTDGYQQIQTTCRPTAGDHGNPA